MGNQHIVKTISIPDKLYKDYLEKKEVIKEKYGVKTFSGFINFLVHAYYNYFKNKNPNYKWVEELDTKHYLLKKYENSENVIKSISVTKENQEYFDFINQLNKNFSLYVRLSIAYILSTLSDSTQSDNISDIQNDNDNEHIKETQKKETQSQKESIKIIDLDNDVDFNLQDSSLSLIDTQNIDIEDTITTENDILAETTTTKETQKPTQDIKRTKKTKSAVSNINTDINIKAEQGINVNQLQQLLNQQISTVSDTTLDEHIINKKYFEKTKENYDAFFNSLIGTTDINDIYKSNDLSLSLDIIKNLFFTLFFDIYNKNILNLEHILQSTIKVNDKILTAIENISKNALYIITSLTLTGILDILKSIEKESQKTLNKSIHISDATIIVKDQIVIKLQTLKNRNKLSDEEFNTILTIIKEKLPADYVVFVNE
ncbi:hypothetical protein DEFDS_P261 (plasmid) [Deferribacter desulfuricans SSM1]|uniref:Uncharacterized protein n=1 Tax=Deferribacter desulfuricans (strain DSM 14783 / JCM 11476 / NBRC 101012 / SSM1) TaxID=639282 RepID=D3PF89_DEFDS|nr:hypothetical protein [Deferribacter desulfuricans]BAI81881.1 hypothetical protein DEFDS_P261 [Deferribacter desulfuricans SSM1]